MASTLAPRSVVPRTLERALADSWSRETSADPAAWTADNAAWGQCAVSALIVQDYLGGELRRGEVGPISHYWNVLPSGEEIDVTRHQFADDVEIAHVEPRTREYLLSHADTARRYVALARAVRASIQRRGTG